jgi:hypothetical protein
VVLAEGEGEGATADVEDVGFHGPHVGQDCTDEEPETDAFAPSFHEPVVESRVEDILEIVHELMDRELAELGPLVRGEVGAAPREESRACVVFVRSLLPCALGGGFRWRRGGGEGLGFGPFDGQEPVGLGAVEGGEACVLVGHAGAYLVEAPVAGGEVVQDRHTGL